jgi:ABC-type multidrug transport system fused ATPase/permease subunit
MHYLRTTERFRLQGKPKCAKYNHLNNLINGLTYEYFREITKPSEALMSKLEDKRILNCLESYTEVLCEEFSQVEQSLQNMIKKVYQHIDFRSLPKNEPNELDDRPSLEQVSNIVETLLMAAIDYHKLNFQVLLHLILKIGDQIETMEINVKNTVLTMFLRHTSCNTFFGGLHILELIKVVCEFVKLITDSPTRPWTPEELKSLQNHKIRCEIMSAELNRQREQAIFRLLQSPREAIQRFVEKEQELAGRFEEKLKESKKKLTGSAFSKANKQKSVQSHLLAVQEREQIDHKNDISVNLDRKNNRNMVFTGKDEELAEESLQLQPRNEKEKPLENVTNIPFFWVESTNFFVQLEKTEVVFQPISQTVKKDSEVQHLWVIISRNFAFLVFYYGQLPVFWVTLKRMKVPSWLLGFLFSLTTLFSLVSNYLFNKHHLSNRYRLSFTLTGLVLLLAIILQILASGFDSIPLLVLARIVAGFAEGLVTTDTYIVRVTPEDKKSYFGYLYVGSHGLAISLGCGLSALLGSTIPEYKLGSLRLDETNYLSIFLLFFYIPGLLIFYACFSDPAPKPSKPAQPALAEPLPEAEALSELDPYEFNLSEIHEMATLPKKKALNNTFNEAVLNERKEIKKQDLEEKIRYIKRYFLKDQTNYIAAYMFVMHTIHECVIIETPFMLSEFKQLDHGYIGLYFFLIFPVLLCFSLGHWLLKGPFKNGHIFRNSLISLFVACLIKFQYSKEVYPLGVILLGSTLVLALSLGAESCALSVLTELASEHHIEKRYGVGFRKYAVVAGVRGTMPENEAEQHGEDEEEVQEDVAWSSCLNSLSMKGVSMMTHSWMVCITNM